MVKKGENIIDFDSLYLAEALRDQKKSVAKAETEKKRAANDLDRIKSEIRIDLRLAEIDRRLAEIAQMKYKGNDALQKETLAVQFEKTGLLTERVKLQAGPKIENASEMLKAKQAALASEVTRQKELEKEIASCEVKAPHDGWVFYRIPEGFNPRESVFAQGEPVQEGQKLMYISDLKRMAVRTLVHEGKINKVRFGQKVDVRVDAFPGRILTGKVDFVATVANQGFSQDARLYEVVIAIDGEQKGDLKPGMSSEVAIAVAERANCLRVPSSALLGKGKDAFCYVLAEKELHARKVTVGISDGKLTEIQDGLKEGESILRNPRAVVEQLK